MVGLLSQIAYGGWQKIHHGHYLTTLKQAKQKLHIFPTSQAYVLILSQP